MSIVDTYIVERLGRVFDGQPSDQSPGTSDKNTKFLQDHANKRAAQGYTLEHVELVEGFIGDTVFIWRLTK